MAMKAEIISIGSELTSGQNLDTNGQWLSLRLAEIGIPVGWHTTVADDLEDNAEAFRIADAAKTAGHEVRVVPATLVRTLGVGARKTKTDRRDAQMLSLLKLDFAADQIAKLRSVRHYNGLPIDARSVTDDIVSQEGK